MVSVMGLAVYHPLYLAHFLFELTRKFLHQHMKRKRTKLQRTTDLLLNFSFLKEVSVIVIPQINWDLSAMALLNKVPRHRFVSRSGKFKLHTHYRDASNDFLIFLRSLIYWTSMPSTLWSLWFFRIIDFIQLRFGAYSRSVISFWKPLKQMSGVVLRSELKISESQLKIHWSPTEVLKKCSIWGKTEDFFLKKIRKLQDLSAEWQKTLKVLQ